MTDQIDGNLFSNKTKTFLTRKRDESINCVNKLKRKRNITKALYYTCTLCSIITSAVLAGLSTIVGLPSLVITILSITSAIFASISMKFNFHNKSIKLNTEIERRNKLIEKLDYVVTCNGNLNEEIYNQIIKEFT